MKFHGRHLQFAMSKSKVTQQNAQECVIFNTFLDISHNFQGMRHYFVNVWEFDNDNDNDNETILLP